MSLILNIDTSLEIASVCLARAGTVISALTNQNQKDHAAFLHPAIKRVLNSNGSQLSELDAIAVTEGPGSYTGLRVGMASVKGLCFAIDKPLITVGTLEAMTATIQSSNKEFDKYIPMIDARRMEVFTACYNKKVELLLQAQAMILDEYSFGKFLTLEPVLFFGSGAQKWKKLCKHPNAVFGDLSSIEKGVAEISHKKYYDKSFTELVNTEPLYLKAFQDSK